MKKLLISLCLITSVYGFDKNNFVKEWNWNTSYEKAKQKSEKEDKEILLFQMTEYCGYCDKVKEELFALEGSNEVIQKKFIPLIISESEGYGDLPNKYQGYMIPTVTFIKKDGNKKVFYGSNAIEEIWEYISKKK